MTKQEFFEYCLDAYGTEPDYPFDDLLETAVLRHADNCKWYAIVMRVSRRKFGLASDEVVDVLNHDASYPCVIQRSGFLPDRGKNVLHLDVSSVKCPWKRFYSYDDSEFVSVIHIYLCPFSNGLPAAFGAAEDLDVKISVSSVKIYGIIL